MKNLFSWFLLCAAVMVSCTVEPELPDTGKEPEKEYEDIPLVTPQEGEVVFTASVEGAMTPPSSKIALGDCENGTYSVNWVAEDAVDVIWMDAQGVRKSTVKTADNGPRTSFATKITESDTYWAGYPSGALTLDFEGAWVTIPAETEGLEFDKANMAVATTTADQREFLFKNICGIIRLKVTREDIRKVVIVSNTENLAGRYKVTFEEDGTPSLELTTNTTNDAFPTPSKTVTVNIPGPGEYYVPVSPTATLADYAIRTYNADGLKIREVPSETPFGVKRSTIAELANFDLANYFVSSDGKGDKNGLNWENAMSYQAMCELLALNRPAESGAGNISSDIQDIEGYALKHNTEHVAQVDGTTFYMAEGTYKPSAYTRISWPGLDKDVNISILGGYSAESTGTDLTKKSGETTINSNSISGTDRAFYIKDNVNIGFSDITFTGGVGDDTHGGGAFFVFSANEEECSTVTLNSCTFRDNTSISKGGAIYLNVAGTVNLKNCTFENNTAKTTGGAVSMLGGTLNVEGCRFAGNKVADDDGMDNSGGAIYAAADVNALNITSSEFTANTAGAFGGAISYYGQNLTIDGNCVFKNNRTVNRKNDIGSTTYGGAIYIRGPVARISNSTFKDNAALNTDGSGGWGGDIHVHTDASATVTSCTFSRTGTDATATSGGALGASKAELTLKDVTITGCNASNHGGAIYLTNSCLTIEESEISDCTSGSHGAAVYSETSSLTITGSELVSNKSTGSGGALYSTSSPATEMDNVLIDDCDSGDNGGAIYFGYQGVMRIRNSIICDCDCGGTTKMGGGIYVTSEGTVVNCENVTFEGNHSSGRGGAVCQGAGASNVYMNQCCFIDNSVVQYGGALAVNTNSSASYWLNNCALANNKSDSSGSGCGTAIWMYGGNLYVNNSSIYGNASTQSGKAASDIRLGANKTSVIIVNTTIMDDCETENTVGCINDNSASGSSITLTNNIILNRFKSINRMDYVESGGYNYISAGFTGNSTDTVLETTDFDVLTQVGDNPWFGWTVAAETSLTDRVTVAKVRETLAGTDFLTWLDGLTVKAGNGTATGALDYDIAGNARGADGYVPGCYQGN